MKLGWFHLNMIPPILFQIHQAMFYLSEQAEGWVWGLSLWSNGGGRSSQLQVSFPVSANVSSEGHYQITAGQNTKF